MAMQPLGTMMRDRMKGPMMDRQDSRVKSSMQEVMKLGRKNKPKMPTPMMKGR